MSSGNHFRILSICDDDGLRLSRELLLRRNGYETDSVSSQDYLTVDYVRSFGVALICPSVDSRSTAILIERLGRYNPEIQILYIDELRIAADLCFDMGAYLLAGPDRLLQAVGERCDKARRCGSSPKKPPRPASRSSSASAEAQRKLQRGLRS
jgi:hypothetical protein